MQRSVSKGETVKVNKKNKQLCNMHKNKSTDKKIIEKTLEILRAVV